MCNYLCFIILIGLLASANSKCNNQEFLEIINDIQIQKEIISDKILTKYGDITTKIKDVLFEINHHMSSSNKELDNQEEINHKLTNKENELKNKTNELFDDLKKLQLMEFDIDEINLDNNGVQINNKSVADILDKIQRIEDQLLAWNELIEDYNRTNVHDKIMNIPHSVSEELTFIENALDETEDLNCIKNIEEELKKLFKELSTLLNFDEMMQDVLDLNKVAKNKNKEATDQLQIIKKLPKMETEANELNELANALNRTLGELTTTLTDLNIKTLLEIGALIQANEEEIEKYSNEIRCYAEFLENCHIKNPSDTYDLPECMKGCNEI